MPRIVLQEGVSVHCAIDDYLWPWDDRTPVLMMHGFARNALFWNRWVPAIAETHRVYRPDLLGCGLSDQPLPEYHYTPDTIVAQIIGVLDTLSLSRVHWIGESSGGLTACCSRRCILSGLRASYCATHHRAFRIASGASTRWIAATPAQRCWPMEPARGAARPLATGWTWNTRTVRYRTGLCEK